MAAAVSGHLKWCCQLLCVVADDVWLDFLLVFCRAYARLAMCLPLIEEEPTLVTGLHAEKKRKVRTDFRVESGTLTGTNEDCETEIRNLTISWCGCSSPKCPGPSHTP